MTEQIQTTDNNELNRMRKFDLIAVGVELAVAAAIQTQGNSSDLAGLAILTTGITAFATGLRGQFSESIETRADHAKAAIFYGTIFITAVLGNHYPDFVSSTISNVSSASGEIAHWVGDVAKGGGAIMGEILKVVAEHPMIIMLGTGGAGALVAGKAIEKYRRAHPPVEREKDPRTLYERSVTALRDSLGITIQVTAEVPGLVSRIMKGVGEYIRATKSTPPNPPRE